MHICSFVYIFLFWFSVLPCLFCRFVFCYSLSDNNLSGFFSVWLLFVQLLFLFNCCLLNCCLLNCCLFVWLFVCLFAVCFFVVYCSFVCFYLFAFLFCIVLPVSTLFMFAGARATSVCDRHACDRRDSCCAGRVGRALAGRVHSCSCWPCSLVLLLFVLSVIALVNTFCFETISHLVFGNWI